LGDLRAKWGPPPSTPPRGKTPNAAAPPRAPPPGSPPPPPPPTYAPGYSVCAPSAEYLCGLSDVHPCWLLRGPSCCSRSTTHCNRAMAYLPVRLHGASMAAVAQAHGTTFRRPVRDGLALPREPQVNSIAKKPASVAEPALALNISDSLFPRLKVSGQKWFDTYTTMPPWPCYNTLHYRAPQTHLNRLHTHWPRPAMMFVAVTCHRQRQYGTALVGKRQQQAGHK